MVHYGIPHWSQKHEKVNIKVPPGLCAVQCVSTGGHLVLGETRTSQCYLFDALLWKWSQIAAIEFNEFLVQNFTLVASGTYVYSVGGTINDECTDVVLKYPFYFNRWSCCSELPYKVKEIGNCVKDKWIYLVAGNRLEDSDSRDSIRPSKRNSFCSKMFCCLNWRTGKMKTLEDLPVAFAIVNVFLIILYGEFAKFMKIYYLLYQKSSCMTRFQFICIVLIGTIA